jgi:hypothetical protein
MNGIIENGNAKTQKTAVYRAFSPPIVVFQSLYPKALPLGWVIKGFQPFSRATPFKQ